MIIAALFISCENEWQIENPADYANDYSLDNLDGEEVVEFHKVAKEKFMGSHVYEETEFETLMEIPVSEQAPPPPPPAGDHERKLVKTAWLSVEVKDLEASSVRLDSLLRRYQAYIGQDDFQNSPHHKFRNLTIRVPAGNLDALVAHLAGIGEYLDRRSVSVNDVTMEFTDTELRLKSKRAVLDQYLKLLDRADKMEDVLKIEKEIRLLREEIESREGQLRYLNNQVTLSTIHLEMSQEILRAEASPSDNFWRKAGDRLVAGWALIQWITLLVLNIWPLLLLVIGIWVIVLRRKRRKAELT